MKKLTNVFLLICLVVVSCQSNDTEKPQEKALKKKVVEQKIQKDTILFFAKPDTIADLSQEIALYIYNNTDSDTISFGTRVRIEKKVGNIWEDTNAYELGTVEGFDIAFNDLLMILSPTGVNAETYRLGGMKYDFSPGIYRFRKEIERNKKTEVIYARLTIE